MQGEKWSRYVFTQSLILAVALFTLLGVGGCIRSTQTEGAALSQVGAATSVEMAQYYEGLAQGEEMNYRALLFTNRALLKADLPGEDPQVGQETRDNEKRAKDLRNRLIQQFQVRARAAKQLAATYTALQNLASYDATAEAERASGALVTELQSLEVLPTEIFPQSPSPVSVDGLTKTAAGLLLSTKQSRDIRQASRAIETTISEWRNMVAGEAPAYKARSDSQLLIAKTLIGQLVLLQQFGGNALFKDTLALFQVQVTPGEVPSLNPAHLLAAQEVINEQYAILKAAADGSPTGIERSLQKLHDEHQKFREQKPLSLGELTAELHRLKEILDVVFPPKKESM
jgi:hypothetical protein